MDDWIVREVSGGIARLLTLSLDRAPAIDTIKGTVHTWCESISEGRVWDEQRDAWRFQAAFRRLAREATRWPTPSQFLTMLPAARAQRALAKPKPNPEVAKAAIDEALEILRTVPKDEQREYRRGNPNPMSVAARELMRELEKQQGEQGNATDQGL